jgi:DNA topoisomerase-1
MIAKPPGKNRDSPKVTGIRAARKAGLRYVNSAGFSIRRVKVGTGFQYLGRRGNRITAPGVLRRIQSLAIPPAWQEVTICPDSRGHLQATGRDARKRLQYLYHRDWRLGCDATKFARMLQFSRALPAIRRQVRREIRRPGLGRRKVLAAIIRLMDLRAVRVGNEEYARQNGSFGLTTLRNRHAKVSGTQIKLNFKGKSSQRQAIAVNHPRLSRIVKRCQDLPGQKLFQYLDEAGTRHQISSDDVNSCLYEMADGEFTSKDFRTWKASVLALKELKRFLGRPQAKITKRNLKEAVARVAGSLGNTPAICRKCYIHPLVLECFSNPVIFETVVKNGDGGRTAGELTSEEHLLARLIKLKS